MKTSSRLNKMSAAVTIQLRQGIPNQRHPKIADASDNQGDMDLFTIPWKLNAQLVPFRSNNVLQPTVDCLNTPERHFLLSLLLRCQTIEIVHLERVQVGLTKNLMTWCLCSRTLGGHLRRACTHNSYRKRTGRREAAAGFGQHLVLRKDPSTSTGPQS